MNIEVLSFAVTLRYKLRTARRMAGETAGVCRRAGLGAAVRYLTDIAVRLIEWYHPVRVWLRHRKNGFDRRFGVDTSGLVHPSRFADLGGAGADPHHYKAITPEHFHAAVRSVPIRHGDFEFVDYGSGKGRALLLASEYPFRRITGVEFAPELHQAALRNITRFRNTSQRCFEIDSVCADASAYLPPESPCVLFFYDPFGARLMAAVLDRIEESLVHRPRDLYLVYCQPRLRGLVSARPFLEAAASGEHFVVFRAAPSDRGKQRSYGAATQPDGPPKQALVKTITG